MQAIGYAEYVNTATRADHIRRMHAEGFPDYEIRPPGDRPESVVIAYNEPFIGRNTRAIGIDLYADATRAAAMDKARETGEAAITGRVVLAGDSTRGSQPQQPGFLMFCRYSTSSRASFAPRPPQCGLRLCLQSLRVQDLMRGILDEGVLLVLDMRIYDEPGDNVGRAARYAHRVAGHARGSRALRAHRAFPDAGARLDDPVRIAPEFDTALRAERLAGARRGCSRARSCSCSSSRSWKRGIARPPSMRDPLTGLFNRRYLDETMGRELPRARRLGQSVGIIVLDLDHFKLLNDNYGHDAGDYVLARMGELLRTAIRSGDIPCRFGGEEFGVIMPGASLENARNRAEAIRAAFGSMELEFDGSRIAPLTLSAGVTALSPHDQDWGRALRLADKALYAAKQAGRNRVMSAIDAE